MQAGKYVKALMSDLPERNGWSIAQFIGDRTPDKTQRLLNHAGWDTSAAMGAVRRFGVQGIEEAARTGRRRRGRLVIWAIARHTVLTCAALAICAVTAALLRDRTDPQAPPPVRPDQEPPADPGMIPLTVPQVRRLLAAVTTPSWPPGHIGHWDEWTRRHQARARWFHKRARLARDAKISLAS